MVDFTFGSLKEKRQNLGLSLKKLASLAGVNITTLRQMEAGLTEPRRSSLNKVLAAIERIELEGETKGGSVPQKTPTASKPSKSLAVKKAKKPFPGNRKPKPMDTSPESAKELEIAKSPPKPEPVKVRPKAAKPRQRTTVISESKPSPKVETQELKKSPSLHLSNIDLELINRMLGLTSDQKIDLLKYLFKLE